MMEKIKVIRIKFFLGIAVSILAACGSEISSAPTITELPLSITNTPTATSVTPTISPTKRISRPSKTPTPTIDPTEFAIYNTEATARAQIWNNKATQIAEFSVECDDLNSYASRISPDEKWFASSCGYKRDQTLIVQNKEGTKWVLDFKNFLNPEALYNGQPPMGGLYPKFWSPDGEYLYFTSGIGYDGGGDDCFPSSRGDYGLFRINLKTGSWTTLIPPTDSFPGYGIEFSLTGRRYAATIDGVMVTDLNNVNNG